MAPERESAAPSLSGMCAGPAATQIQHRGHARAFGMQDHTYRTRACSLTVWRVPPST